MAKVFIVRSGHLEVDRALNGLGTKSFMRRVAVPSSRAGLNAVLPLAKQYGKRQSARGRRRPPVGSASGPMSRFVAVRAISAKARSIGAKLQYNTKKFPGFIVHNKAGKRFFYPAAQEYGTQKARPPIRAKRQFYRAMGYGANVAFRAYFDKFQQVLPGVVEDVRRKAASRKV